MKRKQYVILLFALISGAFVLKFTTDIWVPLVPECDFLRVTGFYCPGCGGTRAVLYLLSGHFIKAALCNPGVIVLIGVILLFIAGKITGRKILPEKVSFWAAVIAILLIYYILRNFTSLSAVLQQAY